MATSCHKPCFKASPQFKCLSTRLIISILLLCIAFMTLASPNTSNNTTSIGCIEAERDALLTFRAELIYDDAHRISSWGNQTDDCCHWAGVGCDNISGRVVHLNLQRAEPSPYSDYYQFCDGKCDGWGLSGNISRSLFKLHHLKYLDLSGNCFINISIPKLLGSSLKNLVHLDLSCSSFTGVIPHELGNLTRLRYFNLATDVGVNYKVDDAEWLSGLSSLRYLSMDGANFSGVNNVMESLNKLQHLKYVSLSECSINNIPVSVPYQNFTSLSYMDIAGNMFEKTGIPDWLFQIPSLRYLSIAGCRFGTIPSSVGNATSLQSLDLSFNREISGCMPRGFGNLCNLQFLYLDASFVGKSLESFRDAFYGCIRQNLSVLSFRYSSLQGRLPEWLGELRNLSYLFLDYNCFNSTIPASLGRLSRLRKLYLSGNMLYGSIPASLGNLSRLQYLQFPNNALNGSIPESLGRLSELQILDLGNNALNGHIPKSLGRLSRLQQLDLQNNALSGSIPESLGSFSSALDLANKSFFGVMASNLENFGGIPHQLFFLSLSSNNLTGSIPNSLCNLVDLVSLDLSNNHLDGVIPNCWNNLTGLKYLILSNNSLAGEIPDSLLSSSQSLEVLHLSNNQLHGEFPSFLKRSSSITTLALNHNNLSLNVPIWVGETMKSLMILTLKKNNFSGILPLLSNLTTLHFLDLSHNSFAGSIPQSYSNLKGMIKTTRNIKASLPGPISPLSMSIIDASTKGIELHFRETLPDLKFIDLSANHLTGQIPNEIVNLVGLQNLDLSCNNLSGEIPRDIGLMQSLESLNLSKNELIGSIPPGLSTLHFLESLNLSQNNLSGKIPYASQLTTLNDPSIYAGNPNLCGAPLDKNCTNVEPTSPRKVDDQGEEDDNDNPRFWFCIGLMPGFVTGFWIVWGVLLFNKEWRYVYFRFLDQTYDMMYVKIIVGMHKIKRSSIVLRSM